MALKRVTGRLVPVLALVCLASPAVAGDGAHSPLVAAGHHDQYRARHVKALDPVSDGPRDESAGNLMALYYSQEPEWLLFRVDLFELAKNGRNRMRDDEVAVCVLLDYRDGGTRTLPDASSATTHRPEGAGPDAVRDAPPDMAWDAGVRIDHGPDGAARATALDAAGRSPGPGAVRGLHVSERFGTIEVMIALPDGFAEATVAAAGGVAGYTEIAADMASRDATPVRVHVFTAAGGRILDTIDATNQSRLGAHNVAFVQHGNQGMTYSTVFRGERGETPGQECEPTNPDDGFDEVLAVHECYSIPGSFHLAATLQTAAEWHDPGFNDWLQAGVSAGWADMVTSAYAQHIMPFVQDGMNNWAVNVEKQMTDWRYGGDSRVAWVPERVWLESPDNDGNGIDAGCGVVDNTLADNWLQHGVQAVILDDAWHMAYYNTPFEDRHIYILGNGLKIVPIDNDFVGAVNWNWGDAWDMIVNLSPDEILVYGNDWEFVAEVSQGAGNAEALNNYINIIKQASINSATVSVWKIGDAINNPAFYSAINPVVIQNATYGLLGGQGGYGGGCNSWYIDWASYAGPDNSDSHVPKWDYGTIWSNTWAKLVSVPSNNLSEAGWYTMMSMLHETGWHDDGQISGWAHHYSNHIKNASVHAEAARWAAGLYSEPAAAFTSDIDQDGTDELVIHNDRVHAVFESIGGRLLWMFARGGDYAYSVINNDPVYWVDTNGDYNETNHIATLSDVSVGGLDREHELYALEVVDGAGDTVAVRLSHPVIEKTITAVLGQPYLRVRYDNRGERTYVKSGWTPDLLDQIWSADITRVWGAGGSYFGYQSPNTNATGAVVAGSANANHNLQFDVTLLGGDEFRADEPFEVLLYGGYATTADGSGSVPELEALAGGLVDRIGPRPLSGVYYAGPDRLVIVFDQNVRYETFDVTGLAIDDDDDGVADVLVGATSIVGTTVNGRRIEVNLDPTTASALEALNPETLELLMVTGTAEDLNGNVNPTISNQDDVTIGSLPPTLVTIDGFFDPAEWSAESVVVEDWWDSAWTTPAPGDTNEVQALHVDWDQTYLYVGVEGKVHGNSWILYLDADFGGPGGETDLTAINVWERGATFSMPGLRVDWQYGAYQHQGPFDGDSFWKITSPTTTEDASDVVLKSFDPNHVFGDQGGSELAIPWDILYELGPGQVPPNATIALVASICWDPEPDGQLGGDVAPDNVTATLPAIDNAVTIVVDADGDGIPDGVVAVGPGAGPGSGGEIDPSAHRLLGPAAPNPLSDATTVRFQVQALDPTFQVGRAGASTTSEVTIRVFNVSGRLVRELVRDWLAPGTYEVIWDRTSAAGKRVPPGTYFVRIDVGSMGAGDVGAASVGEAGLSSGFRTETEKLTVLR